MSYHSDVGRVKEDPGLRPPPERVRTGPAPLSREPHWSNRLAMKGPRLLSGVSLPVARPGGRHQETPQKTLDVTDPLA
jgi:hypothetical protein